MRQQDNHHMAGGGLMPMPGPDHGNEMEMAILKHQQVKIDLEKAQDTIRKLQGQIRDKDQAIVRLHDTLDVARAELTETARQRNFWMQHDIKLAVQMDSVESTFRGMVSAMSCLIAEAKRTAQAAAAEPAQAEQEKPRIRGNTREMADADLVVTTGGEVLKAKDYAPERVLVVEQGQILSDDDARSIAQRFAPGTITPLDAKPGEDIRSAARRLLDQIGRA